jgi:hypothetical protein
MESGDTREFTQTSFIGGMNLLADNTKLGPNQYGLAFNIRNRFDVLSPVKASTQDTAAPSGKKQGLYSVGDYLVLFSGGKAYYRKYSATSWTSIANFQMSTTVDYIYTCLVPASVMNLTRKLPSASNTVGNVNVVNSATTATPAALVCQDGVNQPWLIFIDPNTSIVSARVSQTYAQWSMAYKEYVPIGTLMTYLDGRLYIIGTDQVSIYASVTGRPLDFVVNIDINGNKGGDATTVSYSVGYLPITHMSNLDNTSLFLGTLTDCHSVIPDKSNRVFGEPTYIHRSLFLAGVTNQFSAMDVLGDKVFLDPEGLRSFNAILQERNEGRNNVFSLNISKAFSNLVQGSLTCCAEFDNYAIFSINTIYGPVLAIYDEKSEVFVGFDTPTDYGIKMLAQVGTQVSKLYGITTDNKVFELYSSSSYLTSSVRTRSFTLESPRQEMKNINLRLVCNLNTTPGNVTVIGYNNDRRREATLGGTEVRSLPACNPGVLYPAYFPVLFDSQDTVRNLMFNQIAGGQGWKASFQIQWTGGATITHLSAAFKALDIQVSTKSIY